MFKKTNPDAAKETEIVEAAESVVETVVEDVAESADEAKEYGPQLETIHITNEMKRAAVAYLAHNPSECPEPFKKMYEKLMMHENGAAQLKNIMEEAKRTLETTAQRLEQAIGAIHGVADLIADSLPDNKVPDWADAYSEFMKSKEGDK